MVIIIAYSNLKNYVNAIFKICFAYYSTPREYIVMFAAKFMLHVVLTLGPVYHGLAVDSVAHMQG